MTIDKILASLAKSLVLSALLAFGSIPAHAASLEQAKNQGMVCELPTGYLQATSSATPEIKNMVNNINGKRKAEYARIANQNNVKPEDVGILTGKKLQPKCQ